MCDQDVLNNADDPLTASLDALHEKLVALDKQWEIPTKLELLELITELTRIVRLVRAESFSATFRRVL